MAGKKKVIKPKPGSGQKPVAFQPGGLHESLGVSTGTQIPAGKMRSALAGKAGPKAKQQAQFAKNVLGVKTGTKGARKGNSRGR
jgi:hypothetical protein